MLEHLSRRQETRAFSNGDRVTVFRFQIFRRPYIEGQATVVGAQTDEPDVYLVQFDGEPHRVRERLIFGGAYQANPDEMLRTLLAQWRATLTPEILTEFFPGDLGGE